MVMLFVIIRNAAVSMKHHFSLSFRVSENYPVDVNRVATDMSGSDFYVEASPLSGTEFSVHFVRDGEHAIDLLSYAREQVLRAVPGAEMLSMEMSDELPIMGVVDDITKVVIKACQVFGDPELAHTWLSQPQVKLSGQVPKVLMIEAEGRTEVSHLLTELQEKAK